MGSGDGRAQTVGMVACGGGKAETEAAAVGGKRQSSPRFADPATLDEISGGNSLQPGEQPRRRRKVVAKRTRLNVDGTQVQNNINQAQSPPPVVRGPQWVKEENVNLKLQLALKTTELKEGEIRSLQDENRRLHIELIIKSKEIESLQKQNEDLKAESEQFRKNAKPRKCRNCGERDFHDSRNYPKRQRAASSPEEEDGEESY